MIQINHAVYKPHSTFTDYIKAKGSPQPSTHNWPSELTCLGKPTKTIRTYSQKGAEA